MTNNTKSILIKALIGISLVTPVYAVYEEQGEPDKRPVFKYKPPVASVLNLRNDEDILVDFEEEIAMQALALTRKSAAKQSTVSKH